MALSSGSNTGTLEDLVVSTLALLGQFLTSVSPDSSSTTVQHIDDAPNPLKVLNDSAKLVKAHTTKLSLLAINKPFTPSAIGKVVKELASTCLPAMMGAVQICEQEKAIWGSMMGKEVQARVRRIWRELEMLLKEVLSIAAGGTGNARRDSLSSTGVVWESCDALIELDTLGLGGLALQKAQQYRETIKDAISELQEWSEGDDLATEGHSDTLLDPTDEGVDGDVDSIDDIFNAANSMPANRPDLKDIVEEADSKLKKVVILFNALVKRRISMHEKASAADASVEARVMKLDKVMSHLRRIPFQVDEMASVLYDLDADGAKLVLRKCLGEALSAGKLMRTDWDDNVDGFTPWLEKWEAAIS